MAEQEFFTVKEIAKMLKVSEDTIIRHFGNEAGVIDLGSKERLHKRRYRVLRIPASVLNRFLHKKRVG
jgi:DeoR/GlpR family transcriptional regulator of sugar metabolism